ncbi:hypothetical protein LIPSTDRAFT_4684 [Lipomyces starkeyi NRRL Y-11557]|uniref:MULE transposase domain-containing protein n=1 Tax=Lipomyces starkeyi NRRL Y-11557 TaxID=675824 RepID=A0A1E3Q1F9_LIPST|nr:hypothetical protein LIPSTDRAFT_4684 [Lipomyces starkeyi NRRL Y-11557]
MRRVNERQDGPRFNLTCSSSNDRKYERHVSNIRRYTDPKEFFECGGEIHIKFSKMHESAIIIYEHNGHTELPRFHVTEEICNYIMEQKHLPPRQIYWNLIQLADDPRFEKTELHTITRQQVYNVWLSNTKTQWARDTDNFRSAQLLIAEQDGYHLIEGRQEPGVSLALTTPCFSNYEKYNCGKMTEVFIDSTFGTNKHGYELYRVLAEYDLVSLPLSYLVKEDGKRGIRLTGWLAALRDAGLNPNVVHTDKDFRVLPSENPETVEENDEGSMEPLGILRWAFGDQCASNPRMQRDICRFIPNAGSFIAHFKRPYEEALGRSQSEVNHTMKKPRRATIICDLRINTIRHLKLVKWRTESVSTVAESKLP